MSVSALKAGVDRKTARKYLNNSQSPKEQRQPHNWRTRPDPLEAIWPQAEAILAKAPELEAKALFEFLLQSPESVLKEGHLRTFQRRVQQWRATQGPDQEVMFNQRRQPGDLLEVDWTHPGDLDVCVQGEPLEHVLCHGVLAYSNWQWALRCQSESFLSLVGTLQACFGKLGRVPKYVSTDNSSAATHEIESGKRSYNSEYLDVCMHYDFEPVTINVGCPHEHGDVESANRHLKRRIDQHLLLRGSRDFESTAAYDQFVARVLEAANRRREVQLAKELAVMRPAPTTRLAEYRELRARVSSNSTIRVRNVSYSVPSRLIGQHLRVEQYEAELKIYLGRELLLTLPPKPRGEGGAVINFRHVLGSLLRKPGAFANYQHREQMYPNPIYRSAYDQLVSQHGERGGVIEYLLVLKLAAERGVEAVEEGLRSRIMGKGRWRAAEVGAQLGGPVVAMPEMPELRPELESYDALIGQEVEYVN